ncbi:MAG: M28 family peptidase [Bacteroidales bacterium]|nr:M28 family peptidase [Bacteroidales bacterium]MCF8327831.1 M28 family peptidase [Bacteroidales bacterium]
MKTVLFVFLIFLSGIVQLNGQNQLIQKKVNMVSGDTLFEKIHDLQQFDRTSSSTDRSHVNYILDELRKYDFDTIFQQSYSSSYPPNLVAIKYGIFQPDNYYVAGAHYDAVVAYAGADDNASGTSGILEMARAIDGVTLNSSLILVLFSAEEVGLAGSDAFLDEYKDRYNMQGMLNMDMISYLSPGDDTTATICFNTFSGSLKNHYRNTAATYVPALTPEPDSSSFVVGASDHSSFWSANIPALMLCSETDLFNGTTNPYYHLAGDTIGTGANCPSLATLIVKSATAFLLDLTLSSPFARINNVDQSSGIVIYPNPSNGIIRIKRPYSAPADIRVNDLSGRLVHHQILNDSDQTVNLSHCNPGVYVVCVRNGSDINIQKIILK